MQEFESNEDLTVPDYHILLTDNYTLRNEVSESFYNMEAPPKPDSKSFQSHFKTVIFN